MNSPPKGVSPQPRSSVRGHAPSASLLCAGANSGHRSISRHRPGSFTQATRKPESHQRRSRRRLRLFPRVRPDPWRSGVRPATPLGTPQPVDAHLHARAGQAFILPTPHN
ncbi:MAG: hypothetical protein ACK55I_22645, partial [bacterium]